LKKRLDCFEKSLDKIIDDIFKLLLNHVTLINASLKHISLFNLYYTKKTINYEELFKNLIKFSAYSIPNDAKNNILTRLFLNIYSLQNYRANFTIVCIY